MELKLTNTGTEPCLLIGFPGVSLTSGPDGQPIGAPAVREGAGAIAEVLLAPGQTGSAPLRYTHARNYLGCSIVKAAGFRIYPPEDTASLFLPLPTKACTNTNIKLLTIGPFQHG